MLNRVNRINFNQGSSAMVTNKSLYSFLVMSVLSLGLCLGSPAYSMGKVGLFAKKALGLHPKVASKGGMPIIPDASQPIQQLAEEHHTYTIRNNFPYPIYVNVDTTKEQLYGTSNVNFADPAEEKSNRMANIKAMIKDSTMIKSGEAVETLFDRSGINFNVLAFVGLHPRSGGLPPRRPISMIDFWYGSSSYSDTTGGPIVFEISAVGANGKPITFDSKGLATSYPTITYPIKFIIRQQSGGGVPAGTIVADKIINKEEVLEENVQLP